MLDASFENELKSVIVENLENIRASLIGYRINGLDGMRHALERSIGSFYLNPKLVSEMKKGEDHSHNTLI